MSVADYVGYWTGEFTGTNRGGFAVDLRAEAGKLVGTAKFSEPAHGQYEYSVAGGVSGTLSLRLTPLRANNLQLGVVQVIGALQPSGELSGQWKSSIGTEGAFVVRRAPTTLNTADLPKSNSVFLVHGHDMGAMHEVARFLEQVGVKPVILQEQINRGMTVIEKFEDFAKRAGFAVVLFTPDDLGYAASAGEEARPRPRPRQNVLLELGYFAAKLGREKTLVLVKGDLEWPSDILGLTYVQMSGSEGWKMTLAKDLKGAGFPVDLNKML